jgi:hypothetical protein
MPKPAAPNMAAPINAASFPPRIRLKESCVLMLPSSWLRNIDRKFEQAKMNAADIGAPRVEYADVYSS